MCRSNVVSMQLVGDASRRPTMHGRLRVATTDDGYVDPLPVVEHPGVIHTAYGWGDLYVGTADSMVAAGILRTDQVPGAAGRNKVSLMVRPDGSVYEGKRCSACPEAHERGGMQVTRRGRMLSVSVKLGGKRRPCARVRLDDDAYQAGLHDGAEDHATEGGRRVVPREGAEVPQGDHLRLIRFSGAPALGATKAQLRLVMTDAHCEGGNS